MIAKSHLSICTFAVLSLLLLSTVSASSQSISAKLSTHLGVQPGDTLDVSILMQSPRQLGGIDFKVHFVDSIFRFISATQDTGLKNWEWSSPSYDSAKATVRFPAIADLPFPPHPDPSDFFPNGSVAKLRFVALDKWSDDSSSVPFTFYWGTCGDNANSNVVGDTLLIVHLLFDASGALIWDETDNFKYPDADRPPYVGVPDSCLEASSKLLFQIDLQNGFATNFAICGNADGSQSVDISDAVYLIAYIFSGGPAPNPIAAGDTDCSGTVDISDAVLLVSYIFGGGPAPCSCR